MTTDQPTPNAYAKLARRFGLCPACNRPAVSHSGEGCPQRPADVLPQEPPVGEFVACGPDSDLPPFFRRFDQGWFGINGDEGATWSEVVDFARERAGRDPVRLVPATDVVDAGIVRELAEALLLLITAATNGHMPLPSTLHQAREAFARARAEGATGGGR